MKSINREISNILNKHVSIQKCLKRKIINTRSLAKFIISEYNLKYSLDAVISAIRRYDLDNVSLIGSKGALKMFTKMSISTKDNVAKIVLRDRVFKEICNDFLSVKILKENVRLIKAKETLTLIVSQKDLQKKLDLFKASEVLTVEKNLAELRLHFPKNIQNIKGVIGRIGAELATHDINIEEVIYSMPDLLVYVKEKSLVDAHRALLELKK